MTEDENNRKYGPAAINYLREQEMKEMERFREKLINEQKCDYCGGKTEYIGLFDAGNPEYPTMAEWRCIECDEITARLSKEKLPEEDEPLTEQERKDIDASIEDVKHGRVTVLPSTMSDKEFLKALKDETEERMIRITKEHYQAIDWVKYIPVNWSQLEPVSQHTDKEYQELVEKHNRQVLTIEGLFKSVEILKKELTAKIEDYDDLDEQFHDLYRELHSHGRKDNVLPGHGVNGDVEMEPKKEYLGFAGEWAKRQREIARERKRDD
jgi:hypothetical protein